MKNEILNRFLVDGIADLVANNDISLNDRIAAWKKSPKDADAELKALKHSLNACDAKTFQ